jgi:hypothetical protein
MVFVALRTGARWFKTRRIPLQLEYRNLWSLVALGHHACALSRHDIHPFQRHCRRRSVKCHDMLAWRKI